MESRKLENILYEFDLELNELKKQNNDIKNLLKSNFKVNLFKEMSKLLVINLFKKYLVQVTKLFQKIIIQNSNVINPNPKIAMKISLDETKIKYIKFIDLVVISALSICNDNEETFNKKNCDECGSCDDCKDFEKLINDFVM